MKLKLGFFSIALLLSFNTKIHSMEDDSNRALYYDVFSSDTKDSKPTEFKYDNEKTLDTINNIYSAALESNSIRKIENLIKKLNQITEKNKSGDIQNYITEVIKEIETHKTNVQKELANKDNSNLEMETVDTLFATMFAIDSNSPQEEESAVTSETEIVSNGSGQTDGAAEAVETESDSEKLDLSKSMALEGAIFARLKQSAKTTEQSEQIQQLEKTEQAKLKDLIEKYKAKQEEKKQLVTTDQEKIKQLEEELAKAKKGLEEHQKSLENIDQNMKKIEAEGGNLNVEELSKAVPAPNSSSSASTDKSSTNTGAASKTSGEAGRNCIIV